MLDLSQYVLVKAEQDVDIRYVLRLRHTLNQHIDISNKFILLDFSPVSFIDSSGVALILSLARYLKGVGGGLIIVNISEHVFETFLRTGLVEHIVCMPKKTEQRELSDLENDAASTLLVDESFSKTSLSSIRETLYNALAPLPVSSEMIDDLVLAAGEAMGNVVLHTSLQKGHLSVFAFDDRVQIVVQDNGSGFSLSKDENPHTTLEHGRGIKLMRMLVDDVAIQGAPEKGTKVTLTKLLKS